MPIDRVKLVVFGLSISSSWGNGHATLWRGLAAALARRGHQVVFFERDVPYYASHRDLLEVPGGELVLYPDWEQVLPRAREHLANADVGMVTSYCPDGRAASEAVLASRVPARVFYDMDTPVTLEAARVGQRVEYLPPGGLGDFDLVLSFTGGGTLDALKGLLGARRVFPLYGSVDPATHHPVPPRDVYRADLSYLGTWAANRQRTLARLFLEPARRMPHRTFLIGGSMYPQDFPWAANINYVRHVLPTEHPGFYCSSRLTLNVTRAPMAAMGYCPSGRLFEAAACGIPIISDTWEGLETFFTPGREILTASRPDDVVAALSLTPDELAALGRAARERALEEHTADHRADELLALLSTVRTHSNPPSAGDVDGHIAGTW